MSEASRRYPVASRKSPAGCRAFTGGLCSVTTATPWATSRVVWGAILAARRRVQPPTIAVRLAAGSLAHSEGSAGALSWRRGAARARCVCLPQVEGGVHATILVWTNILSMVHKITS